MLNEVTVEAMVAEGECGHEGQGCPIKTADSGSEALFNYY